ncbi:M24 family metallopeptidase [Leptospira interrogans]
MSKHDFTAEEFAKRRSRARDAIAAAGLDWMVLFHPVSIRWLTGSDAKSYQEFQCLLVSAKPGPLTVLTRDGETNEFLADVLVDEVVSWGGGEPDDPVAAFAKLVKRHGLLNARIGIEVPAYYLHPYHYLQMRDVLGAALVAEPSTLIHDLTLIKSPAELAYILESSRIADAAMGVFADALVPGQSELALAGKVYDALLSRGSGIAASTLNLVSGDRSCFSHGAPTERILQAGDFINIEYGSAFRRYTSTIGRQFCLGTPTARMQELHDLARHACDACIAEIRAGVPAIVPHEAAKRVIEDAGLGHGRVHTSGYGLAPGFPPTWGEPIHMIGGSTYTLEAGMVVTIEPPVFLGEEKLGARLIDNVLVTNDGCELLSTITRDLIVK